MRLLKPDNATAPRIAIRHQLLVLFAAAASFLTLNSGCAQWSYDNIQLGQTPREYARALPEAGRVQAEIGLCSLDRREKIGLWWTEPRDSQTESIVLLLTSDRRVAGKFRAVVREQSGPIWDVGNGDYELVGELSAGLYGTSGAGAVDTIRALLGDLTDTDRPKIAADSHSLVAGGLLRLIWPETENPGISKEKLRKLLRRVPGGGERSTEIRDDGVLVVRYSAELGVIVEEQPLERW